jgi:phosphopantothenoylcysteine decarboxylase/phosphopantothenate--cysteine ligase
MATGQCDNLLLATYLSAICPVVAAPAMDEDMWKHSATKENILKLESFGNKIIPVEKGDLASGLYGDGRMAEPEKILEFITANFFLTQPLANKKAIVTAGPTYEPIDPVRIIGNNSSGKMGIALAEELQLRGAEVTLILGPTQLAFTNDKIKCIRVQTAEEMYNASVNLFDNADIAIMAAAVADYKAITVEKDKIKKKEDDLTIELTKTKDILKSLGDKKNQGRF